MRFRGEHDGKRVAVALRSHADRGRIVRDPRNASAAFVTTRFVPTVDRQTGLPAADPRVNNPASFCERIDGGEGRSAPRSCRCVSWIDVGDGWRVDPRAVRALQRFSVPLRPRRTPGRHRCFRLAGGAGDLVLFLAGSALRAGRRDRSRAALPRSAWRRRPSRGTNFRNAIRLSCVEKTADLRHGAAAT